MGYLDLTSEEELNYNYVWDSAREMMALDEPLWRDIGKLLMMVINDYESRHPRERKRQAFDAAGEVVLQYERWLVNNGYRNQGD